MGNDYYVTNEHRVAAGRQHAAGGRGVRLLRDHAAVLRALPAAGHAHGDQYLAGSEGRRGRVLAVEGMGQRPAPAQQRRAGRRASRGIRSPTRSIGKRPCARTTACSIRSGLFDLDRKIRPVGEAYRQTHRRLARRAADAEPVPDAAARSLRRTANDHLTATRLRLSRQPKCLSPDHDSVSHPESKTNPTMRFTDKVCIVTGGGSGIGRAACERFAAEGGKVAVVDLNQTTAMKPSPTSPKRAVRRSSPRQTSATPLRCVRPSTPRWPSGADWT